VCGPFHAGQRVQLRLRVDAEGLRAGDTARVIRADRAPATAGGALLYFCEIDTAGGPRLAALFPNEIEPLEGPP
jgi:hypothetical protein